ncbi:hypothetical protein BIT28_00815 [Photobacterium proteolyticum]|uniref:Uncharacterized protein n=1 Tax=Photobacterium proteolyticum TaxID=1903952 RepID=A0A1Q9H7K0_9GAMM|nr:hypothetical protein [Photobacterium proteolyticum]OLQ83944.1 hypothetical protein BIT28_00815 [Photobacterium proteolyticum]
MAGNIQIVSVGDGKNFKVNMRGKSFQLVLNSEEGTFEMKGDIPKEVSEDPESFLEWLLPKVNVVMKSGDFKYIN